MRKAWIIIILLAIAGLLLGSAIVGRRLLRARQQETAFNDFKKRLQGFGDNGVDIFNMALEPNPPMDALMAAVKCSDGNVRREAAKVLGLISQRSAVGPLLEGMKLDNGYASRWCIWALGRIGDRQAVQPLIERLGMSTRQIMAMASSRKPAVPTTEKSFNELVSLPVGILLDESDVATIEALGDLGDARAVDPLIARLQACVFDVFGNQRFACEESLSQLGPPAVPALIAALKNSDQRTQESILEILGRIGDAHAAQPIIDCLHEPHVPGPPGFVNQFVNKGLLALAQIGSPEALAYLGQYQVSWDTQHGIKPRYEAELLRRSPDSIEALQRLAADGGTAVHEELARLKDNRTIPAMVAALDTNPRCAKVLEAIGSPAIVPLAEAIKARPGYATWPILVLGNIGDPAARAPLWQHIRDNPKNISPGQAAVALAKLNDRTVIPLARQWLSNWRKEYRLASSAISVLAILDDTESIPGIAEIARTPVVEGEEQIVMRDRNSARAAAISALVTLKASDAGEIALKVVAEASDQDPLPGSEGSPWELYKAAIDALVVLQVKDSAPVLQRLLANSIPTSYLGANVHLAAIEAVVQFGDTSCAPLLLDVLDQAVADKKSYVTREIGINAANALVALGTAGKSERLAKLLAEWEKADAKDEPIKRQLPDSTTQNIGTLGSALCRAIASSGDAATVEILVKALGSRSYSIRCGAVTALGNLGDKKAFTQLAGLLDADNARNNNLRLVAGALLKIDEGRAVNCLIQWLHASRSLSPDEAYIVQELGQRKRPQASAVLKDRLLHVAFNPTYSTALTFRGDFDSVCEWMRSHPFLAYTLPRAYAQCAGEKAIPTLILAMRVHHNWHIQTGAAEALGELGDRRGVEALVLALRDKAWPVQHAAAVALGQIGDPAAVPALEAAAKYGDLRVRRASAAALKIIMNKRDVGSMPSSGPSNNTPQSRSSRM